MKEQRQLIQFKIIALIRISSILHTFTNRNKTCYFAIISLVESKDNERIETFYRFVKSLIQKKQATIFE